MAKKSKRSVSSKKSAESAKAKKVTEEQAPVEETKEEAAVKSNDDVKTKAADTEPEVDEVVEVVEVEEPTAEDSEKADNKPKLTLGEKLAALNPAALVAELLGTFILSAAFIQLASNTNYGTLGIAFVLATVTIAFGAISGSHFNPAVSIAQWITRRINGVKAVSYVIAQVLGAILAFFILTGINNIGFDYNAAVEAGVVKAGVTEDAIKQAGGIEKWAESYGGIDSVAQQVNVTKEAPKLYQISKLTENKEWVALLSEILGSVVFGLGAAYAIAKRKECRVAAGLVMGFALLAGLVIAGKTAVLNPAVAATLSAISGSNFASVAWSIVVYVLGPIIGVTLGVALYGLLTKNEATNAKSLED